jgi:hypothetical protein
MGTGGPSALVLLGFLVGVAVLLYLFISNFGWR